MTREAAYLVLLSEMQQWVKDLDDLDDAAAEGDVWRTRYRGLLVKTQIQFALDRDATVGLLATAGAICPKCGYGTRVTSKNWAKCKKCGERVRRERIPPCSAPAPAPVQGATSPAVSPDGSEEGGVPVPATSSPDGDR